MKKSAVGSLTTFEFSIEILFLAIILRNISSHWFQIQASAIIDKLGAPVFRFRDFAVVLQADCSKGIDLYI